MSARFDLIGLVVTDLDRSLDFYRLLGVDVPAREPDQVHVEVVLSGGLRLAWDTVDTVRSFDPSWTPPSGGHGVSLAFECEGPAGVDSTFAALVGAGAVGHLPPWDAVWGQRYATVHDPDGHSIDLFAALD